MRVGLLAAVMLTLGAAPTLAQNAQNADSATAWSASATVITYVVPDEGNYVQPTVSLDRKWLHVEGRLNYEAMNTAALILVRTTALTPSPGESCGGSTLEFRGQQIPDALRALR